MLPSVPKPRKDQANDSISLPRKVFQGVAKRTDMFRMFDRHAKRPNRFGGDQSATYAGEWFEIDETSTVTCSTSCRRFGCGPDLAMREFMTGSVTLVFYAIRIDDAVRYFHTYCDLSIQTLSRRCARRYLDRETRPVRAMSRENGSNISGARPRTTIAVTGDLWPKPVQGRRTVMLYGGKEGTLLKLLETLTDDEIAAKLPVHLRHLPTVLAA